MKYLILPGGGALFLLLATGCGDPGPTYVASPVDGTLIVDFTLDGGKDPSECHQSGATTIDVTVETTSGATVGEFQADCESFATSIDLPPGHYDASAVLLDGGGADRTTPVDINAFVVHEDSVLTIPIEFPASSFL